MSIPPGTGRPVDDKWREWRLDELGEPTDISRLNANSRRHGLLPKLSGGATEALLGDGTWGHPLPPPGAIGDMLYVDPNGDWVTLAIGGVNAPLVSSGQSPIWDPTMFFLQDMDYGDITVSSFAQVMTVNNGALPLSVMEGTQMEVPILVGAQVLGPYIEVTLGTNLSMTGGVLNASGGATDLSYTAATRIIASSTGADATLPLVSSGDAGLAPASGGGTVNYLRADGTWTAPSAVVAISTASVAFTDGDTARRVTISDAAVSATSKIICSVMRPTTADDSADKGYVYDANVVRRAAGAFDVFMRCTDIGGDDCTANPPNETLTLCYQVA